MIRNKVTTIGGAAQDLMFYTDEMELIDNKKNDLLRQKLIAFEYGAKIYSKKFYLTWGGGGANTAVNFASLGIKSQVIVAVGDDLIGRAMIEHLKKRKVNTKLIQKEDKTDTGISFIVNVGQANEHVIFAYRGANDKLDLNQKLIKKINTPWIYLTSLSGNFTSSLENIFHHSERKKIKVAWNPGSNQLQLGLKKLAKYMRRTEVFDVNRDEALELLVSVSGAKVKDNINYILKNLHKYGQKLTVVTDGPRGAYVYDGQKVYFQAALKKRGVNTTGAGDAFGSAFVAGLIKYKGDLTKALKLAIINSNAVVMKVGAQEGLLQARDLKKYNL